MPDMSLEQMRGQVEFLRDGVEKGFIHESVLNDAELQFYRARDNQESQTNNENPPGAATQPVKNDTPPNQNPPAQGGAQTETPPQEERLVPVYANGQLIRYEAVSAEAPDATITQATPEQIQNNAQRITEQNREDANIIAQALARVNEKENVVVTLSPEEKVHRDRLNRFGSHSGPMHSGRDPNETTFEDQGGNVVRRNADGTMSPVGDGTYFRASGKYAPTSPMARFNDYLGTKSKEDLLTAGGMQEILDVAAKLGV